MNISNIYKRHLIKLLSNEAGVDWDAEREAVVSSLFDNLQVQDFITPKETFVKIYTHWGRRNANKEARRVEKAITDRLCLKDSPPKNSPPKETQLSETTPSPEQLILS